jgi:glucose/arabinose dehydrogenase
MRSVSFGRAVMLGICAVCLFLTVAAEAQRAPRGQSRERDARGPGVTNALRDAKPEAVAMSDGGVAGVGIESLTTLRVASGLAFPVGAAAAPGDTSHLYIIQKAGAVRSLNLTNGTVATILNITVTGGTSLNDERGLLGIAFHPNYPTDPYVYFNFTLNSPSLTTIIRRYTVTNTASDPIVIDPGSAETVIQYSQPFGNHNGGWIDFGPNDGYLYIAAGDGGDGCDPGQRAQDITTQLLGKLLRLDVNSDAFPADPVRNYAIPPTNPFVGVTGDDEIWAYGLRNPWRCGFDRMTGDLFIADVGQFVWEEINFQPATSPGGENYGWDCMEGFVCSNTTGCTGAAGCSCATVNDVLPIGAYSHSGAGNVNLVGSGCSITGGSVYRGSAIPSLDGTYFYADFCNGIIGSFTYNGVSITNLQNRTAELAVPGFSIGTIASFAEDAMGELYIVDQGSGGTGEVYKIVPATGACCLPNGSCVEDERESDCVNAGGTWHKNDTCAEANCPQPTGACCLSESSCINATEAACNNQGGIFHGPGTMCAQISCEPGRGACCLESGQCIDDFTAAECALFANSVYQGDDTLCIDVSCGGDPTGACCLADGSCIGDETAGDCAAAGGTYQGDDSDCVSVKCPQPTGACCLVADGECADALTVEDCEAQAGVYQGDGTNCLDVTCPQDCPADFVSNVTFQPPPDGVVDAADLAFLLGEWGPNPGSPADMVSNVTFAPPPDGFVDAADLAFLLGDWGPCK